MGYIMELRKLVGSRPLIMAGACVIVLDQENRILLQRRTDSQDWGTVGGSMELGESLEETAARELLEETGLTSNHWTFKTVLSGKDMYYRYPHGDEVYNVMAVYEVRKPNGIPRVGDDGEGLELRYFAPTEPIPNLNPFSEHVLRKLRYLS